MTQLEIHFCQTCARYDASVDGCNGMGLHPKPCDIQRVEAWNRKAVNHE